jgi:hypothetical protein
VVPWRYKMTENPSAASRIHVQLQNQSNSHFLGILKPNVNLNIPFLKYYFVTLLIFGYIYIPPLLLCSRKLKKSISVLPYSTSHETPSPYLARKPEPATSTELEASCVSFKGTRTSGQLPQRTNEVLLPEPENAKYSLLA